nr:DUF975 family protein [uncultured Agathobaculum sp.]
MSFQFDAQTRRQVKKECRAHVWNNLGRCIGIQVLYTVPYLLLAVIMIVTVSGGVFALLLAGYTDQYLLSRAVSAGLNGLWIVLMIMLVITGPLQYGLMRFYIGLQRGEEPGISTLFQAFTSLRALWTGIKMVFCIFLRSFLWMIVPTVIFIFVLLSVMMQSMVTFQMPSDGLIIGIVAVYVLAVLLIGVKLLAYEAGWVVLYDQPNSGVWSATAQGARAFRGQYGRLLWFVLTFAGWYVLLLGSSRLCLLLGEIGYDLLGNGMGLMVYLASVVASLCLSVVLGGFVSAYYMTSFFKIYEKLAAPAWQPPVDDQPESQDQGDTQL